MLKKVQFVSGLDERGRKGVKRGRGEWWRVQGDRDSGRKIIQQVDRETGRQTVGLTERKSGVDSLLQNNCLYCNVTQ